MGCFSCYPKYSRKRVRGVRGSSPSDVLFRILGSLGSPTDHRSADEQEDEAEAQEDDYRVWARKELDLREDQSHSSKQDDYSYRHRRDGACVRGPVAHDGALALGCRGGSDWGAGLLDDDGASLPGIALHDCPLLVCFL
jgi:hypothetical protein